MRTPVVEGPPTLVDACRPVHHPCGRKRAGPLIHPGRAMPEACFGWSSAVMAARDRTTSGWSRERWMDLAFALGATGFFLGPFPGYAALVGAQAVAVTFFVGSLLFTLGGALQTWLAAPQRHVPGAGRAGWWTAIVQLAGTLFFNASTFRAMWTVLSGSSYDRLVCLPDALGSRSFR